jgi:hypothetical protein
MQTARESASVPFMGAAYEAKRGRPSRGRIKTPLSTGFPAKRRIGERGRTERASRQQRGGSPTRVSPGYHPVSFNTLNGI